MTPERKSLQQLQRDLNGHMGTTFRYLNWAWAGDDRPYVFQVDGLVCCRHTEDGYTDRFPFTEIGVSLLRAEVTGLGLLPRRPLRDEPLEPVAPAPSMPRRSSYEWLRDWQV